MHIEGTKILAAPRAEVWAAFNDPEFLRQAIPGCQKVVEGEGGRLDIQLTFSVGPIKANFSSEVEKKEVVELSSYVLEGKGSAGPAGSGSGRVQVFLQDVAEGTQLDYQVDTQVSGRIAQLGARMIDGAARRFSEEFFANATRLLSDETPAATQAAATRHRPAAAVAAEPGAGVTAAGLGWKVLVGSFLGTLAGTLIANWLG